VPLGESLGRSRGFCPSKLLRPGVGKPAQRPDAGQETVFTAACDHESGQAFYLEPQGFPWHSEGSSTIVRTGHGIFFQIPSEKSAAVHLLGLDELELAAEIGANESEHQSPVQGVVFHDTRCKDRAVGGSATDHPVDSS
jgi:hypothetical protein